MQQSEQAIVVRSNADSEFLPAMSIEQAVARYNAVLAFTQQIMKPEKDYGVIPGTGDKPTLLKPGAEKLCSFFGLAVDYEEIEKREEWDKGFFFYSYKAILTRGGGLVATGIGSCNSKEKKYRYRNAERCCPGCGRTTIIKGKAEYGGGWICFTKKGGCGEKYADDDPSIVGQEAGKVENTEPFDLVNTIQKMAQKRALIAATLIAANASEFYTQDVEDLEPVEVRTAPKLATPEQVSELKDLLAVVRLPEGTTDKWLAKSRVDAWEDMPADTIAKCIKYLKDRMPTNVAAA